MVLSLIKNYIQTLYSHSISYYDAYQKNPTIYTIYSNYVKSTYLIKTIYLLLLNPAYDKINIDISQTDLICLYINNYDILYCHYAMFVV